MYISHFSNQTFSSLEFESKLGLTHQATTNQNCLKVGQELQRTNCLNNEGNLRGVCQYKECITTQSKPCSFPFKYKGRMYDSCITIDSIEPWCSLKTDVNRNHIESVNTKGTCSSSCNIQNCPVGFFKHDTTCLRISAQTDHDSWISTEQAEEQCIKEGARLYQPRDIKSFKSLLLSEFEHLQPNQSHFMYRNKESFIALGAKTASTNNSLILYLDRSRAYMLESIMNDEGNSLNSNKEDKCIMLDKNGKLALANCENYYDGLSGNQAQLGYICEANHFVTKGGRDPGEACVFPFRESVDSQLQTSCVFDDVKGPWCATAVDDQKVVHKDKWGLCMDERKIAYNGTGSGKECIIPFIYNGVWKESCPYHSRNEYWCPTLINPNRTYMEGQELGFCTDYLISKNTDCPESYEKVGITCVRISPISETFKGATAKCTLEGGNLISIHNVIFHMDLIQYIQNISLSKYYFNITTDKITDFWIGGTVIKNMWTWISNEQNITENWINNTLNTGCLSLQCTDEYGLTMNVKEDYKWKADHKKISKPYICESKCRPGYRWGQRSNKCLKASSSSLQGVSNVKSMLSCALENSRLVSVSNCQEVKNLTQDIWELFPTADNKQWIGYFSGNFQYYNMRRISKSDDNSVTAINSKGLALTKCNFGANNTAGYVKKGVVTIFSENFSELESLKGFVCEVENDWMCPDGYTLFQEECYMFVNNSNIFTNALMHCMDTGGHLAEPQHMLHVNFIQAFINYNLGEDTHVWTGYRRSIFNISEDNPFTTSEFNQNLFDEYIPINAGI